MLKEGAKVLVEEGAGLGAYFTDEEYENKVRKLLKILVNCILKQILF